MQSLKHSNQRYVTQVGIGFDLTTDSICLTEVLLLALPVDIVGHEEARHTAVARLPFIANV